MRLLTDFPDNLRRQKTLHLGDDLRPFQVENIQVSGGDATVKLVGIDDATTALAYRQFDVSIPREAAQPLGENEFFWHDVVGLLVVTTDGEEVGSVTDILRTGANEVYVVATTKGEVLIPAIEQVIVDISPEAGRMVIRPMPGMLD